MEKNILIIDTGSSGMKGLLFNPQGVIRFQSIRTYRMEIAGKTATQKVSDFSDAMTDLAREAADFAVQNDLLIEAMAVTSQRSSLICMQKDGSIAPEAMMWYDKRPKALCEKINASYKDYLYQKTGSLSVPALLAPKILWKKKYEWSAAEADLVQYDMTIQDFLIYRASGEVVTDPTIASRSGVMDLGSRKWDQKLLDLYEIDREKLPRLMETGMIAGRISAEFAKETGLKEGIPVITAGGDQQASALGLGIADGDIGVTLGSGGYAVKRLPVRTLCREPEIADDFTADSCGKAVSCSEAGIMADFSGKFLFQPKAGITLCASEDPALYNAESAVEKAGTYYNQILRKYGRNLTEYEQFQKEIEKAGIRPAEEPLPDLFAEKTDLKQDPAKAGNYVWFMASELAEKIRRLTEYGETKDVILSGGLSGADYLVQMVSDFLKRPVFRETIRQSTAIGAWKLASAAVGWYASVSEAEKALIRKREIFVPNAIQVK